MEQKDHFDKLFAFCVIVFLAVVAFDVAVVFKSLPQTGEKYADILMGSLNTGALMTVLQFLFGGSPPTAKKDSPGIQGDNNTVVKTDSVS